MNPVTYIVKQPKALYVKMKPFSLEVHPQQRPALKGLTWEPVLASPWALLSFAKAFFSHKEVPLLPKAS